jgi:hypothetical protein
MPIRPAHEDQRLDAVPGGNIGVISRPAARSSPRCNKLCAARYACRGLGRNGAHQIWISGSEPEQSPVNQHRQRQDLRSRATMGWIKAAGAGCSGLRERSRRRWRRNLDCADGASSFRLRAGGLPTAGTTTEMAGRFRGSGARALPCEVCDNHRRQTAGWWTGSKVCQEELRCGRDHACAPGRHWR